MLVLKFCKLLCSRSADCRTFRQRYRTYLVQLEAYNEAEQRRRAPVPALAAGSRSNEQHAEQLLAAAHRAAPRPIPRPQQPTMPKEMDIRNAFQCIRFLLVMSLLYDYIRLFDQHATKCGGVNWIKCMTENELVEIEKTLIRWRNQSELHAKSPVFAEVCERIEKNGVWTNVFFSVLCASVYCENI